MTPGDLLDRLGVTHEQVTDPDYGYTGTFTPRTAFGHWTASAAGSDISTSVLVDRCYHACVNRSGVVKLGGWAVRQGHGGNGRHTPNQLAIDGRMTLDELKHWQASTAADDTSTMPNQYGYGVCLDNNGLGEPVPGAQWHAWTAAMAAFTVLAGGTTTGSVIDHSASTNRKIDLSGSPTISVDRWWNDIATQLTILQGGPAVPTNAGIDHAYTPTGRGYYVLGADGGVFTYGDAQYRGGLVDYQGPHPPTGPARSIAVCAVDGYSILTETGQIYPFGTAGWLGAPADDWT